jgi:hypothetical protein
LHVQAAERALEAVDLRRAAAAAAHSAEPAVLQLRQLLLDPAAAREFMRLRNELEATRKELQRTKEELQACSSLLASADVRRCLQESYKTLSSIHDICKRCSCGLRR